ncbi:MAG: hypothetical protein ACUVV0_11025, partial [Anaerolineae bacterium]
MMTSQQTRTTRVIAIIVVVAVLLILLFLLYYCTDLGRQLGVIPTSTAIPLPTSTPTTTLAAETPIKKAVEEATP